MRLSRGYFLGLGSGAVAAAMAPAAFRANAVLAQTGETDSLAVSIGKNLAGKAGEALGGAAFDKIMSLAGIDLGGREQMARTLDDIVTRLAALEHRVEDLTDYIEAELTTMKYDTAYLSVKGIISRNGTLGTYFQHLLEATAPNDIAATKEQIKVIVQGDEYATAMSTWHDALTGANGQTGLIAAWCRAVFASKKVFNADQADRIQRRWDAFDAQQALTCTYLVNSYNDNGQPGLAASTLQLWWSNRRKQLAYLRGCSRATDVFPENQAGNVVNVTTKLNSLPPSSLYCKALNTMWYTDITGPYTSFGDWNHWTDKIDAVLVRNATKKTHWNGWHVPSSQDFITLARECGASIGESGGSNDYFLTALQNNGFTLPTTAAQTQLTTNCGVVTKSYWGDPASRVFCNNFVEGGTWQVGDFYQPLKSNGPALYVYERSLGAGESYWYS